MDQSKVLVVDLSNIVHYCRHSSHRDVKEFSKSLVIAHFFYQLKKVVSKYKVDSILIACDSPNVWRYEFYPVYKSTREDSRDEYYPIVKEAIIELKDFFNTCTNIPAMSVSKAEADDIVAVFCQEFNFQNIVLSTDKDFIQLIGSNTRLYNPLTNEERTSNDPAYDLFVKCIRGDRGDAVLSAYPRVRESVLSSCWKNPEEMLNLLETRRKDGKKVGECYELNRKLIDLTMQPLDIREDIKRNIEEAIKPRSNYNQMRVLKFLSKYELHNIAKEMGFFGPMFRKGFSVPTTQFFQA